jgi:solute carrier family 35 protein F5
MSAQEPILPPAAAEELRLSVDTPSVTRQRLSMSSQRSFQLKPGGFKAGLGLENVARRTLGIALLLVTVFLWTASNFLASVNSQRFYNGRKWKLT